MIERVLRAYGVAKEERLVWEGGWVALGQAGTVLGSLIGLKVLTQILPKDIFGQVNLLTVAMILPGWILFAPVLQAAIRIYAPSREARELASLLRTSLLIYVVVSGFVAVVGLRLVYSGLFDAMGIPRIAMSLTIAVFLADTWQLLGTGICGAARLRKRVASLSTFVTWARPLCAVAFVVGLGPSIVSVMAGYLAASLLILPLALRPVLIAVRQGGGQWVRMDILSRMVAYGAPFAIWSALAWGQTYADRYVLQLALGAGVVGPYVAAYQVAGLPFNFGVAFLGQFITPIVFERAGAGTEPTRLASARGLVGFAVGLFAGLGAVIVLIYALAGDLIMGLLTHADYVVPSGILALLASGALAQNIAQLLATSVLAHNRPKLLIWAFFIPVTLSVPASWLLVRLAGVWGAALTNATTSFIFLTAVGWILRTLVRRTRELSAVESESGICCSTSHFFR